MKFKQIWQDRWKVFGFDSVAEHAIFDVRKELNIRNLNQGSLGLTKLTNENIKYGPR